MVCRVAGAGLVRQVGWALFASGPAAARAAAEPAYAAVLGTGAAGPTPVHTAVWLLRFQTARHASTLSSPAALGGEEEAKKTAAAGKSDQKALASYWGVPPSKFTKEDGSTWRWACFRVRPPHPPPPLRWLNSGMTITIDR